MTEVAENIETQRGLPSSEYIERYDGSRWRRFDLQERGFLVLTSRGQELLSHNPALRKGLLGYKNEAKNNNEGGIRKWFKAGGNGDVYLVGNTPLVIKEASTAHSVWSAMDRMDYLYGICARYLPKYIKVPDHYGILTAPDLKRQYLIMQKVNEGLTVADLENGLYTTVQTYLKDLAIREFKGSDSERKPSLEARVREAIEKTPGKEYMPKNLLPDWDAGNVIVDFDTPNKEMPFTFWIIDQ